MLAARGTGCVDSGTRDRVASGRVLVDNPLIAAGPGGPR